MEEGWPPEDRVGVGGVVWLLLRFLGEKICLRKDQEEEKALWESGESKDLRLFLGIGGVLSVEKGNTKQPRWRRKRKMQMDLVKNGCKAAIDEAGGGLLAKGEVEKREKEDSEEGGCSCFSFTHGGRLVAK
ncbi:hypothetical protein Dimus_009223 [Dionaea muscipula]